MLQRLLKAFLVDDITLIITPCPGHVLGLLLISKFQSVFTLFLNDRGKGTSASPTPEANEAEGDTTALHNFAKFT